MPGTNIPAVLGLALAACGGGLVSRGPAEPSAMCDCHAGSGYATGAEFPVRTLWWGSCTRDGGPLSFTGKEETVPCNDVPHKIKLRCNGVPCTIKKESVVAMAAGELTIDVEFIPDDGGAHEVRTLGPYTIATPLDAKATCYVDGPRDVDVHIRLENGGLVSMGVFGLQPRVNLSTGPGVTKGRPCKLVRSGKEVLSYRCPAPQGSHWVVVQTIDATVSALVECA